MTNYSDNPGHVRVDRFKPGGKWYDTFVLDMTDFWKGYPETEFIYPNDAVKAAWKITHPGKGDINDYFTIVVLEPYFETAYPVCIPSKKLVQKEEDKFSFDLKGVDKE